MNVTRKQLFAIIYGGLGLLFALVWYSLSLAPVFSVSILAIVLAVVFYVQTEKYGLVHAASEFENRFWTTIACVVAIVCFKVEDSPIFIPDSHSTLRWIMVVALTFLAHNFDRHCRRLQLKRDINLRRLEMPVDEKMRNMLKEVREHLAWIDHPWISSAIMNIFMLSKVLDTEQQLVQMFRDCSHQELNYLVAHSLALIMYKMKDHRWVKKYYRTQFIETLAEQRISELTVISRCILVDALQSMKLSAHPKAEHYVKNIFLKTFGDNLSELKSLSDSKGDFQSMHKLIYFDIKSKEVRKAILDHISTQARVQKAHMRLGTSQSRRRGEFAWRKILSDVDDTLLCSGGAYPAGIDRSLPRKVLYPGVLGFYRELDLGDTGPDVWDSQRTGNLVFLSARPHVYSDIAERHVYDNLSNLQKTRGLYTAPSLLCGSMRTGAQYMFNNTMEPLAQKKVESFKEYAALYAEFEFVFIGDNGQGDVRAAELINEDSLYRGNLKRAYMRKVKPLSETHCMKDATKSPDCPFICYFTTYVEAAIDAYEHKLIRVGGLRQVAIESVKDFEEIDWALFGNKRSDAHMHSPRTSPFGSNQNLSGGGGGVVNKRAAPKMQRVGLKESFRKRYMRLVELNASLTRANVLLVEGGLQPVALLKFECLYKRGTPVTTPFGPGVVEWFRPHDGTYEVLLQMGLGDSEEQLMRTKSSKSNMAFLRSDSLLRFRRSSSSWMPSLRSRSHVSFASVSSANKMLVEQLKTFKKSGVTVPVSPTTTQSKNVSVVAATPVPSPGLDSVEQATDQPATVTYKWIVWTPYGLGILLPEEVLPPPSPLPPLPGTKKVSVAVKTRMVKVKTTWGAVMSMRRAEIVKMKVIAVKTAPVTPSKAAPPPPMSNLDSWNDADNASSRSFNGSRSSGGADLPLELRALLSPTHSRKRSFSVDGGEAIVAATTSESDGSKTSRLSLVGGLAYIPLYNRLFGSGEKEKASSCDALEDEDGRRKLRVNTKLTDGQGEEWDKEESMRSGEASILQASPFSSSESLRSGAGSTGSAGDLIVQQDARTEYFFVTDKPEHESGCESGGECESGDDEQQMYEHDVGLSIDDDAGCSLAPLARCRSISYS
mmetsp:Transcript_9312/g.17357  ORF Transcript_9312/g.17357 Transcript_9312/m.17357 type:complete len:1109 (-) Transcript_9312:252-3578(-)